MDSSALLDSLLASFTDALRREVNDVVSEALSRELPAAIRSASRPAYVSRDDAARYLGRSVRSIDHLRSADKLGWTKRDGRVMLSVTDLDAYLAAGRVPAKPTRQGGAAR